MSDEKKTIPEPSVSMDEPSYEDDEKLGQTMMDIDAKQFIESLKEKDAAPKVPAENTEDEPLEDLLKKKKSLIGKIGNIFHK